MLHTVGVVFLYWERLRFHFAIWRTFALIANFLFCSAILTEITRLAPGL